MLSDEFRSKLEKQLLATGTVPKQAEMIADALAA
jgi:hypothetical protein